VSTREINSVLLSGCLAREPELLDLADGKPVCWLCLACAVGGVCSGRSGYFDVVVLGQRGRRVARALDRGRGVVVQGSLESARWEEGEGPEHEAVLVLAQGVYFVDPVRD
jgi:single-stranded DNA-binding protein